MVLSGIWKKHDSARDPLPPDLTVCNDKNVSAEAVQEICASVGWSRREPLLISRALANSLAVISIWHKLPNTAIFERTGLFSPPQHLMIGFGRATGDQVFNATVWDVVVRPGYQRRGLGRLLMAELLKEIDTFHIPLVTLYADPGTDGFYRQFGFLSDPSGVRGMFREKS